MPAVPTLTVIDNQLGGSVSTTIAGSTPGATNTLRYQSVDGELGGSAWTFAGSRTGDGPLSVVVPIGYHWWKVDSVVGSDAAVSNLVYQIVTTTADAVQERILESVKARVTALDLPGLAGGVHRQKVTFEERLSYPSVVVTAFLQSEGVVGGTSARDDWGKPASVVFFTRDAHQDASEPQLHYWRERVFRAFHGQKLPGVPEVLQCTVEPAQVAVVDESKTEFLMSAFVLRFQTREPRGFGA